MNALLLVRASMVASLGLGAAVLCAACEGQVKVKASTSDSDERTEVTTATPAATPAPTAAPAPVVASAPPADACPLLCYEARGPIRAELTAEEVTQLRSALDAIRGGSFHPGLIQLLS